MEGAIRAAIFVRTRVKVIGHFTTGVESEIKPSLHVEAEDDVESVWSRWRSGK